MQAANALADAWGPAITKLITDNITESFVGGNFAAVIIFAIAFVDLCT